MTSDVEYSRMYYRTHLRKIKARKKAYYLKNRERIIAHQIELNRKTRDIKQASRASQKPIREQVHSVSQTNTDGSRDIPAERRTAGIGAGEHGDTLSVVPPGDSSNSVSPINRKLSKAKKEMVPEEIPPTGINS